MVRKCGFLIYLFCKFMVLTFNLFFSSSEFIVDEAKVQLGVTYIKGLPCPDEIKVFFKIFLLLVIILSK